MGGPKHGIPHRMRPDLTRLRPPLLLLALCFAGPSLALGEPSPTPAVSSVANRTPDFQNEPVSPEARKVADWVVATGDNQGMGFILVDKPMAKVLVFDRTGHLTGISTALLGRAKGDDSVPGIGTRKLSMIRPEERTTPAGRYVAGIGEDFHQNILWIDYDAAISLHRVVHGNPGDHRLERLASASLADKRISYGCINVPARFFDETILKAVQGTSAVVYILPEVKTLEAVFHMSRQSGPADTPKAP